MKLTVVVVNSIFRLFEFRKFVSNRDTCYNLIPRDYPVQITKVCKDSLKFESMFTLILIVLDHRKKKHPNVS